jgi:hypothetical protein
MGKRSVNSGHELAPRHGIRTLSLVTTAANLRVRPMLQPTQSGRSEMVDELAVREARSVTSPNKQGMTRSG